MWKKDMKPIYKHRKMGKKDEFGFFVLLRGRSPTQENHYSFLALKGGLDNKVNKGQSESHSAMWRKRF